MDESRFGCTMSCDEFVRFWQDKKLRTFIYQKAWLWSKSKEDFEDLRQEAWTAVCLLPPDATMHMAEQAAYRVMHGIYERGRQRGKKVPIIALSTC